MRAAVLNASNTDNCVRARIPGMFLRTSVPGYRYGSESSLIPLIYGDTELFEADLAIHVSLEDTLRFRIQVQVFDAKASDSRDEGLLALFSLEVADWRCDRNHCS